MLETETTSGSGNTQNTSTTVPLLQPNAGAFFYGPPPRVWGEDEKLEERQHLKGRLALAFRILGHYDYFYASAGHITVRDPVDPNTFLMNPFGLHFSLMTASDILRVNHDGDVLDGGKPDRRFCNRAGFLIHAAVHESRPESNAVVHSHSPYSKAWCSFNADLPLLTQDSSTFYKDLAIDQEFSGVALDPDEGRRIAKGLGNNKAALLGNHGSITVGKSVESAMAYFIKLEKECQVALMAYSAAAMPGAPKPKPLNDVTAKFTKEGEGSEEANYFDALPYFDFQARASSTSIGGLYDA